MVENSCRGKKPYHRKQTNAKQPFSAKLLSHNIKCSAKCSLKSSAVCKCFLHSLHTYFQVPLSQCDSAWIRAMCLFLCPDWLNAWSHTWHLYGFCPLWILRWQTTWLDVLKLLLQTPHSYGFSPVWVRLCTARSLAQLNHLLQSVHCAPRSFDNWLLACEYSMFPALKDVPHYVPQNHNFQISACPALK